jgi:hypothetical protein
METPDSEKAYKIGPLFYCRSSLHEKSLKLSGVQKKGVVTAIIICASWRVFIFKRGIKIVESQKPEVWLLSYKRFSKVDPYLIEITFHQKQFETSPKIEITKVDKVSVKFGLISMKCH